MEDLLPLTGTELSSPALLDHLVNVLSSMLAILKEISLGFGSGS